MSLGSALLRGQTAAEAAMTLTLQAWRPTGRTAQNETTGLEEPGFASEGTTPGKVQAEAATGGDTETRTVSVGGVPRPVLAGGLHIPIGSDVPSAGAPHVSGGAWEYVVTAVGTNDDPALLGRRYRVVDVPVKSFATARRLDVVEVPA